MHLQNEHIRLRKLEPTDLPYLYIIENDELAWQYSDTNNPLSYKDLSDYISSSTGDIYKDGQLRLIIESADADRHIMGCIDLYEFDIRNLRAGIGIYIIDQYRNSGIGSEALSMLESYAAEFLHMRLLYAIVASSNLPSCALFLKNRFTKSATIRKWFCSSDAVIFSKALYK